MFVFEEGVLCMARIEMEDKTGDQKKAAHIDVDGVAAAAAAGEVRDSKRIVSREVEFVTNVISTMIEKIQAAYESGRRIDQAEMNAKYKFIVDLAAINKDLAVTAMDAMTTTTKISGLDCPSSLKSS